MTPSRPNESPKAREKRLAYLKAWKKGNLSLRPPKKESHGSLSFGEPICLKAKKSISERSLEEVIGKELLLRLPKKGKCG